jgi:hypothetical protein
MKKTREAARQGHSIGAKDDVHGGKFYELAN